MNSNSTTYEVQKSARGNNGEWFAMRAHRFASFEAAKSYFEGFAAEQVRVLGNGIRIDLRARRGRKLLATVGGLLDLDRARQIRWLGAEVAS